MLLGHATGDDTLLSLRDGRVLAPWPELEGGHVEALRALGVLVQQETEVARGVVRGRDAEQHAASIAEGTDEVKVGTVIALIAGSRLFGRHNLVPGGQVSGPFPSGEATAPNRWFSVYFTDPGGARIYQDDESSGIVFVQAGELP